MILANFCVIFLGAISATVYSQSETVQETTTLPEDSQTQQMVFETTAPPLTFKPIPRKKAWASSSIDEEGEFDFSLTSEESNYLISIHGAIIFNDTTQTQTLELTGDYSFGNLSISFRANELEGFVVFPRVEIQAGIPIKVLTSLVGK